MKGEELGRKRSLIRPERRRIDPEHRNYYYSRHAQQPQVNILPSSTGNDPILETQEEQLLNDDESVDICLKATPIEPLRIKKKKSEARAIWLAYCWLITFWAPSKLLKVIGGKPRKDQQVAWREKMGLMVIIATLATLVGFLIFGFPQVACGSPPPRMRINQVGYGYLIINGYAYDLTSSSHPAAYGVPAGSNVLYPPVNAGGTDASFLFQNVNAHCKGIITPAPDSDVATDSSGNMGWYLPCQFRNQDGSSTPNASFVEPYPGYACHTSTSARDAYYGLDISASVYFTWDDIRNQSRNLVVYSGSVIDLDVVQWFNSSEVLVPSLFYSLAADSTIRGTDMSYTATNSSEVNALRCLSDIAKVGEVDGMTVGCMASTVVLTLMLVFIIAIVTIKFGFAVFFHWFMSRKLGALNQKPTKMSQAKRRKEIEDWSNDIYSSAPHLKSVKRSSTFFPTTSRFSYYNSDRNVPWSNSPASFAPREKVQYEGNHRSLPSVSSFTSFDSSAINFEKTTSSINLLSLGGKEDDESMATNDTEEISGPAATVHHGVVPQPPPEYQPYNFPLSHCICLVTAYSESVAGLRTTLDSVATTDYPNSHKCILVICDGMIKGDGNDLTTPEIVLTMMKEFVVPVDEVKPYSYVAVATGTKRHNMAKVYAGFYSYNDDTVHPSKQQRVPMMAIVKCGTPEESLVPKKPGNRGKRDSQVILMSFLQKVLFDERMTELEYEIFNGIWKVTGIIPTLYEFVLMVDADTKVYPDSLSHLIAPMAFDPDIMGLCGETKLANKRDSWVTMIQVFEYYVSHHLSKAFESVFGGVTCLPGCFCLYRIKSPKGANGYWVPILANPDIVTRYSQNIVETLHEKNLLLLGEDRYLSALMLKTFPKRKQIFIPAAVCKTVVPNTMKVLLSQRRRWINSTIHNLMELVLVRDLCGTFCFSMQFVIFVELVGTLVLPAALFFTYYIIILCFIVVPPPIVPLILLALILGLPGVLIVVTADQLIYLWWMFLYLIALPVWNIILPLYAYWHMDEFTWGDTRKVDGMEEAHDAVEGEFDGSQIVMKKWHEFEKDRRRRDSTF